MMMKDENTQTRWCSQIRLIAERMCPCNHNELLFHAIAVVPHAVSRNSFQRRKELAKQVIRGCCDIVGDTCVLRPRKAQSFVMENCVAALKQYGVIDPLQYMVIGTVRSYQNVLRRMNWIEVQSDRQWKWIGPPDANYRDATNNHRSRKRNEPQ